MHKLVFVLENETHKTLWKFEIQIDCLILVRRPDLVIVNEKKRTCFIVDFATLATLKVKIKVSEKIDKYVDLAKELKKLWNMRMTVIPIAVGAFGMDPKDLEGGLEQ